MSHSTPSSSRWKTRAVLLGYAIVVFVIVIVKFNGSLTDLHTRMVTSNFAELSNFIPLKSITRQWAHNSEFWPRLNLLGNTLPFVPFGWLLPRSFPVLDRWSRVALSAVFSSVCCEVFQYVSNTGVMDVDDVLLNSAGVLAGYGMYRLLRGLMRSTR